eukprot:scaffold135481_cov30-Tisochrysis_lutea.AAC.1
MKCWCQELTIDPMAVHVDETLRHDWMRALRARGGVGKCCDAQCCRGCAIQFVGSFVARRRIVRGDVSRFTHAPTCTITRAWCERPPKATVARLMSC